MLAAPVDSMLRAGEKAAEAHLRRFSARWFPLITERYFQSAFSRMSGTVLHLLLFFPPNNRPLMFPAYDSRHWYAKFVSRRFPWNCVKNTLFLHKQSLRMLIRDIATQKGSFARFVKATVKDWDLFSGLVRKRDVNTPIPWLFPRVHEIRTSIPFPMRGPVSDNTRSEISRRASASDYRQPVAILSVY